MPTNRKPISRAVRYRLSFWEKLSLEYGEADHRPGFRSDDERRKAWMHHRSWMLARCRDGRRPQAYWDYEAPLPEPDDCSYRQAALWSAGLLSLEERHQLQASWRKAFEEAQPRDFTCVVAPARSSKARPPVARGIKTTVFRDSYSAGGRRNAAVATGPSANSKRHPRPSPGALEAKGMPRATFLSNARTLARMPPDAADLAGFAAPAHIPAAVVKNRRTVVPDSDVPREVGIVSHFNRGCGYSPICCLGLVGENEAHLFERHRSPFVGLGLSAPQAFRVRATPQPSKAAPKFGGRVPYLTRVIFTLKRPLLHLPSPP